MLEVNEVQQLADDALIERLRLSVRNDRRLAVRLLVEMGEVQERGLYRDLGFASMFDFATRKLGMSESEAGLRIRAAKVGRAFPIALELLGRCELNLTTLSLLAPVLTAETIHLLHAARFKSKLEVQALLAAHCPKPDAPDSVRRLPPARASTRAPSGAVTPGVPLLQASRPPDVHASTNLALPMGDATRSEAQHDGPAEAGTSSMQTVGPLTQAQTQARAQEAPPSVVQLSASRHKISFTGSQRVRDLLQEAQDLRRHRHPAGDLEPLFERALELLVAEERKKRFAATEKPRARAAKEQVPGSRHIPHAVQREVWTRDAGQCGFVSECGQRCETRSWLQFHHSDPFARGGAPSPENIMLLCQPHNALCAERDYGRAMIRQCIESGSSGSGAPTIPARSELGRQNRRGP